MESLHQFTDLSRLDQVAAHIRRIKRDLQECDEEARRFNSREALFGKDLTEYSSLTDVQKAFEPYCDLWEVRGHRISKEGAGARECLGASKPTHHGLIVWRCWLSGHSTSPQSLT